MTGSCTSGGILAAAREGALAKDIPTTEASALEYVALRPESVNRYDHPSPHSELPGSG